MAKIVRPVHGRVQVWLPFQRGSGNYDLLKELCGDLTRPQYNRRMGCFEGSSHLRWGLVESAGDEEHA